MFNAEIMKRSLLFPKIEGARYVPDTQINALRERLEAINQEFIKAADDFVANFDTIKDEGLSDVRKVLPGICRTEEHMANAFARIQAEYPDSAVVRKKLWLEFDFFTIGLPTSEAAAAAAKDADPQVKSMVESMVNQLRDEVGGKIRALIGMVAKARETGGTVRMPSIESALEVLNKVDDLNFLGDETLAEQVKLLKSLLVSAQDSKSTNQDINLGELFAGLSKAQETISADVQGAVAAAERKLTGLGARKIG
jgi:hypothetical protein